jgi:hypothetical protein
MVCPLSGGKGSQGPFQSYQCRHYGNGEIKEGYQVSQVKNLEYKQEQVSEQRTYRVGHNWQYKDVGEIHPHFKEVDSCEQQEIQQNRDNLVIPDITGHAF